MLSKIANPFPPPAIFHPALYFTITLTNFLLCYVIYIFIMYICFLPLECKAHEGRDFCLSCSLLYLQHLERCLTPK